MQADALSSLSADGKLSHRVNNLRKTMKRIFIFLSALFIALSIFAIPADRTAISVKQSDGTTLMVRLTGDEYCHYYTTLDGIPVVKEANGDFYYATMTADGALVSTNCLAHNKENRSSDEEALILSGNPVNMRSRMATYAKSAVTRANATRALNSDIKPEGEIYVPILLVEFADVKLSFTKEQIEPTFSGENYTGFHSPYLESQNITSLPGSVHDYFVAQSDSIFKPKFVVCDIVTLKNNQAYYGRNNIYGNDTNPAAMIIEACRALDSKVDFSIFDNDGDGEIEYVYCLYAGYGEHVANSNSNYIWPHSSWLSEFSSPIKLDDVMVNKYACSCELAFNDYYIQQGGQYAGNLSGIGTICHEFSHCLGLMDHYDTSGNYAAFGMDYWDVMDYGDNTMRGYAPVGYNAYERDFMGWRKLVELTEKGNYSLDALTSGGVGYKIVNDANSNEYYILENRQAEGFDKYIVNTGMLIIHVDYNEYYWSRNEINCNVSHERFTIIPADGERLKSENATSTTHYKNNLLGDVWPGPTGNTELTDYSTPAAKVFTGGYMGKPIRDIRLENGVIHFSFMRGDVTTPTALAATEVTSNSFTANWSESEDAYNYILTLEKVTKSESTSSYTNILTEDFYNCTSANIPINSPDSYFSKAGWSVKNIFSNTGTLRIGASNTAGELTTPLINKEGKINISYKVRLHNAGDTGAQLTLSTDNGDIIQTVEPTADWSEESVTITATGKFTITFSTEKSLDKKRVVVDDIKISLLRDELIVPVETIETTETSYTFEGLEENGTYRYSVKAADAVGNETESSDVIYVSLGQATTVETIAEHNDTVEIYTLGGVKIYSGAVATIPHLHKGIYIRKENGSASKMYVR